MEDETLDLVIEEFENKTEPTVFTSPTESPKEVKVEIEELSSPIVEEIEDKEQIIVLEGSATVEKDTQQEEIVVKVEINEPTEVIEPKIHSPTPSLATEEAEDITSL